MEQDKLNALMDEVLMLCNDLNGSENHLYDWMEAGNIDGAFDGMSAGQIADMWNDQMTAYRRTEAARALGKLGGSRNTPAQNAARAANAKHAGRPKGSKNKSK